MILFLFCITSIILFHSIYHSLESVPLRCVQLEDFAPKLNAQLLTASWSHTRPCLFLIGCHDHVFCYDVIEEKAHFCAKIESRIKLDDFFYNVNLCSVFILTFNVSYWSVRVLRQLYYFFLVESLYMNSLLWMH